MIEIFDREGGRESTEMEPLPKRNKGYKAKIGGKRSQRENKDPDATESSADDKPDSSIGYEAESETETSQNQSDSSDSFFPLIPALQQQVATTRKSLHDEVLRFSLSFLGILCQTRFSYLEDLESRANPYFAPEYFALYFEVAERLHAEIDETLRKEPGNYKENIDDFLERLKETSIVVGALKIFDEVDKLSKSYEKGEELGVIVSAFEQVKAETKNLRMEIEPYFQLRDQLKTAEITERSKSQAGSSRTAESSKPQARLSGAADSSSGSGKFYRLVPPDSSDTVERHKPQGGPSAIGESSCDSLESQFGTGESSSGTG